MTLEVVYIDQPIEVVVAGALLEVVVDEAAIEVVDNQEGPMGPPGVGIAAAYIHTQAVAAAEWVVNHNFGARPTVSVFSPGGVELLADVIHVSNNQARIYLAQPMVGSVRCV